jgi:hypothetical protein
VLENERASQIAGFYFKNRANHRRWRKWELAFLAALSRFDFARGRGRLNYQSLGIWYGEATWMSRSEHLSICGWSMPDMRGLKIFCPFFPTA